jgi:hypothetical protein
VKANLIEELPMIGIELALAKVFFQRTFAIDEMLLILEPLDYVSLVEQALLHEKTNYSIFLSASIF